MKLTKEDAILFVDEMNCGAETFVGKYQMIQHMRAMTNDVDGRLLAANFDENFLKKCMKP